MGVDIDKLEELRDRMHKAMGGNVDYSEVLAISRELDIEINKYYGIIDKDD